MGGSPSGQVPRSPSRGCAQGRPGLLGAFAKYATVGSCNLSEWAGLKSPRRVQRRWRDTRATVGTTFRRRSRVFLVGELSKFPLPMISGEASSSLPSSGVQAAGPQSFPVHGGNTSSEELPTGALFRLKPGELVTQAPTSKHVPPPFRTVGCRRCFLQTQEREFPSWSHPLPATHRASQMSET